MGTGAYGDLFEVRYLKESTPVNWVEANEPLHDLETNILLLDGRLAFHMAVSGVLKQEELSAQDITGTDTALSDTLDFTPVSDESVKVFLNGSLQKQGAGNDYSISGTTITWLASTGTAVNMLSSDNVIVVYESEV